MEFDPSKYRLTRKMNLDELRRRLINEPDLEAVYSINTPWWSLWSDDAEQKGLTRIPKYLPYRIPGTGIPCDPLGSPLMQGELLKFLQSAAAKPDHYGRNGLAALEAAFHGNVVLDESKKPTALPSWNHYNDLLDYEAAGRTR